MNLWKMIFGDPDKRYVDRLDQDAQKILTLESKYQTLSDEALQKAFLELRSSLLEEKTDLDSILNEVFAITRETAQRVFGFSHRKVQLMGGMVLHRGKIAEMLTGEGKTLVSTLPVVLNAMNGKGVHVVTVNDYLARRDAGWMASIYSFLGLSTSVIMNQQSYIFDKDFIDETQNDPRFIHLKPCTRKEAYLADITYGTNNEFGFDYLRDNMAQSLEEMVQRGQIYAIVDEVDSILIDEARTPLIISSAAEESSELYRQFARIVPQLTENVDYNLDEKMRAVTLTTEGVMHVEKILGTENLYETGMDKIHNLEAALKAHVLFKRDKDYVVKDGEILIVDEFTGRLMQGRRYSDGLHQAIEAKENVEIKRESRTMATITFQNYFRMYKKLSGMTGTAKTEEEEFGSIYSLDVVAIPPNALVQRKDEGDRIYGSHRAKMKAIVDEIKRIHSTGQPILVGTISIENNEEISELLVKAGVPHAVLNAKQHLKEADIIAQAGKLGSVTIATNMAGRGVDIKLGGDPILPEESEKVRALGGLFVVGTERHESRRIDNQLRGRAGRWGDPGSSVFYVSLDDDLMRIFGSDRIKGIMKSFGLGEDEMIQHKFISASLEQAQKRVEGHNFDIRKHLVEYDDILNKQRDTIYKRRQEILRIAAQQNVDRTQTLPKAAIHEENGKKILDTRTWAIDLIYAEIEKVVTFHTVESQEEVWNIQEIYENINSIFPCEKEKILAGLEKIRDEAGNSTQDMMSRNRLFEYLTDLAQETYHRMEQGILQQYGEEAIMRLEVGLYLSTIDRLWVDHLSQMAHLRSGIGLRGYAQQDPLVEYKREAYNMFLHLLDTVQNNFVYNIYKFAAMEQAPVLPMQKADDAKLILQGAQDTMKTETEKQRESATQPEHGEKIGRNEACSCGSGKKYKKCHGA